MKSKLNLFLTVWLGLALSEAHGGNAMGDIESAAALSWKRDDSSLALCRGDRIVWRLVFDPKEPKSYFHPLATVDGETLTAFEPADHPWHRGLWWSWKFINGVNYWEESRTTKQSEGVNELTGAKIEPTDDFSARAELSFSYHPVGEPAVMTELRKLTITKPDADGCYRIDWTSEFTAGNKPVVLDRTPLPHEKNGKSYGGYAGLSLRLRLQSIGWSVLTSEGKSSAAGSHGQVARWLAFSRPGSGIAIIDHPANARHPAPWYVHDNKPMSFYSPSILFNKPLVIDAGQSIKLSYRILIHSKPLSSKQIETDFRNFAEP